MVKRMAALMASVWAVSLVGCDAMTADEVDRSQLAAHVTTRTLTADSSPEAALILVVPAANVASYVPDGYDLMILPGAADGADGALLWVFAGLQTNVLTDGAPVGTDHLVHVAVQIQEPPPPPGKTLTPGASHLYEIRLIFDNHEAANWGHAKVGEPTDYSNDMVYAQQDPGPGGAGFVSMEVGGSHGGLSFFAEYGPLAPAPPPLAYAWYEGHRGLAFQEPVFANLMASGAGGAVCADAGTWMGDILGAPCRSGGGLALTSHTTLTWTLYP
ncbi:MAG TPA: hypothetical protein VIG06_02090 [Kofleriaceae bacterium]